MKQPLVGWDLATWRVTQSENGVAANVVAIAEINGILNIVDLYPRIEFLLETYPVLRMGVGSDLPISLEPIPNFNYKKYVREDASVQKSAIELANLKIGNLECLWRLHLIHNDKKTFLVCALHHSIADGIKAMQFLQTMFDYPILMAQTPVPETESTDIYSQIKSGLANIVNRITEDPVGLAKDLNEMLGSMSRVINFSSAIINEPLKSQLQVKFYKIDKRKFQNITTGKQLSNHDVLVAFILSALQNYYAKKETTKNTIIANIPVAMNLHDAAANKLVVARIEFEAAPQEPLLLMKSSREKLRKWRREPILSMASKIIDASQLIPIDLISRAIKGADLTISTLVSSPRPLRILGLEIKSIWPLMPPMGAAINLTSVVGGEYVFIGLSIDSSILSDPQIWRDSFEKASLDIFGTVIFEQIFE